MKEQNQDDQDLIDKFGKSNDQIYLLRLFQKYEHLIYGVCLKYSQDPDWSKDLKSQIYEKLVAKAKDIKTENFKNWLYTLSKHHCIDEKRKQGSQISQLEKFKKFQILQQKDVYFNKQDRLIIEEEELALKTMLEKAKDTLSTPQKRCLDLFYKQKYSYLDISQEMGMDIKLVKSHLQNGKRNIKQFIFKNYNL